MRIRLVRWDCVGRWAPMRGTAWLLSATSATLMFTPMCVAEQPQLSPPPSSVVPVLAPLSSEGTVDASSSDVTPHKESLNARREKAPENDAFAMAVHAYRAGRYDEAE